MNKIMKQIRVTLIFIVIIFALVSCEKTRNKMLHNKEICAELEKYSEVLDLKGTKIYFIGRGYSLFYNGPTSINLNLDLKLAPDNCETVISIRDELLDYLKTWEIGGERGFREDFQISFWLKEGSETVLFYNLSGSHSNNVWFEWWRDDPPSFRRPLTRKNIHNEKIDTLLDTYAYWIDIERSGIFHSGMDYIQMWLLISDNDNREPYIGLRDELINFFEDNRDKLIEEYGDFNTIYIAFYRIADGNLMHHMKHQNNKWEISWGRY